MNVNETSDNTTIRCPWCGDDPLYMAYHDDEWGIPVYDDQKLFEMLILEGAQAGLSWITVLKRREGYRAVFDDFEVEKCVAYTDDSLESKLKDTRIIRNRLKVYSVRKNALAFQAIQKEFGSFSHYLWSYVNHSPITNAWDSMETLPVNTPLSDQISKDLKKRGFTFIGSTIIYAYMQAIGMVNDHLTTCDFRR